MNAGRRTTPIRLTERYTDALDYARRLHATQLRKGTAIPYLAHLISVSALVVEAGGDEDQAIAALLHDALEDQGHKTSYDEITGRYGTRVADIVRACSDTEEWPKPPWRVRKERYLAHLETEPVDAVLVSAADKLHNARAILADHRVEGVRLWARFSGGVDAQLWYYATVCEVLNRRLPQPGGLADQLHLVVSELHGDLGRTHVQHGGGVRSETGSG